MAHTLKLGLLDKKLGHNKAKKLRESLGELYGPKITYQLLDLVSLIAPVSIARVLEQCHVVASARFKLRIAA